MTEGKQKKFYIHKMRDITIEQNRKIKTSLIN